MSRALRLGALALCLGLAVAPAGSRTTAAHAGALRVSLPRPSVAVGAPSAIDFAAPYGWPLRPFDRQHVVRSAFGEPRFGSGERNFHFGIDLPAPGATPVYSVAGGTAYREPDRVAVLTRIGREANGFSYWHIVPAVAEYSRVRRHELLGWVKPAWAHLHFAQLVDGQWVNPLRPGALAPYVDRASPRIGRIAVTRASDGRLAVIVSAWVPAPLTPAPPWQHARLAPALVRWRLLDAGRAVSSWRDAVDFRVFIPPNRLFSDVYAPGTTPGKPNRPGRYLFYLARDWDAGRLASGRYGLEVQATASRGVTSTAFVRLAVEPG